METVEVVIKIPEDMYERTLRTGVVIVGLDAAYIGGAIIDGVVLPKGHGRLIDANKVENITWQDPTYVDAWNVLTEVRDKVRELPTIIEADKENT